MICWYVRSLNVLYVDKECELIPRMLLKCISDVSCNFINSAIS
jgi:hypothetical protein